MKCVSLASGAFINLERVNCVRLEDKRLIFAFDRDVNFIIENESAQLARSCFAALLAATGPVDLNAPPSPVTEPQDEVNGPPSHPHTSVLRALEAERHLVERLRKELDSDTQMIGNLRAAVVDQAKQITELRETRKQEVAATLAQLARKDQERDALLDRGRRMVNDVRRLRDDLIKAISSLPADDSRVWRTEVVDMFDEWLRAALAW